VLPPRHDNLFLLARYRLELEGERFPVSPPQLGEPSGRLIFGLAALDAARLADFVGRSAYLIDREGTVRVGLRIERVDRRLGLLTASVSNPGGA
jgi:hypothetical protein